MKIAVKVHPHSKKPHINKDATGTLNVYVTQPAIDNQANIAVIDALAQYFQIKKSAVQLITGTKSKIKMFEILQFN